VTTGSRPAAALFAVALAAACASAGSASAQAPDYDKALRASQAAIGRPVGEWTLRDTAGREVRLSDYRGKPLVVSFVYTGCFQACPVTTRFLATAVRAARSALGQDSFNVVTIGFNQPFDGPEAMASFARQNRIDDPRWAFLSLPAESVEPLTRAFGFSFNATPKGFDHVTQATVVDADGVIYRQVYGEMFELPMLVGPIKELLAGDAARTLTVDNVWTKVKLYCTVYDPVAGGYRLNYSLFVEIFAGVTFLGGLAWFALRELRRLRRREA
jgi:protein SCO1/2